MHINVKMTTNVGILTFMDRIRTSSLCFKARNFFFNKFLSAVEISVELR